MIGVDQGAAFFYIIFFPMLFMLVTYHLQTERIITTTY